MTTMFYSYLFITLCLLFINTINSNTIEKNPCFLLNTKLNKYNIHINSIQNDFTGIRLCENLITKNQCCSKTSENSIQNATVIELYQLFELNTINFYELLLRLNKELNNTYKHLIDNSRNETHLVLQRGYNKLYQSYRLSIDKFFNKLLDLTARTYENDLKVYIEELFRNILHISLTLNNNQTILPTYFSCLWKNQPFANQPNLLEEQLEIHLGKFFHLYDLVKLSSELVQILSTSVTTDYHCIDSYMQLSYCNLCSGRNELPCLSNCINVIESCFVNLTLIDDVWRHFLDAIENLGYFDNIEKTLSSIGLSISDGVMTFFNSGGVQNKEIIDQCGHLRIRRQTFTIDEKTNDEYSRTLSLSLLDRQLLYINQTLFAYRIFWKKLPEQICKSTGISTQNGTQCWTGTSISQDGRSTVRTQYDKPLNLKLQWILKEIKQKSEIIGNTRRSTSVLNMNQPVNSSPMNVVVHNLTDTLKSNELDDYPNDNEFDYSDYAYEDATDETTRTTTSTTTTTTTTSTTTTTTTMLATTTIDDELTIDDTNTVYYDYGDHDVYSDDDDEIEDGSSTTTEQPILITTKSNPLLTTTTTRVDWKERIPYYHRRPPIIWNVNKVDNDNPDNEEYLEKHEQKSNSGYSHNYSSLLLLIICISTRV